MLGGVRIGKNRWGIDTRSPQLEGLVLDNLPVLWWYEPPGSQIPFLEAVLRYKGILQPCQLN